MGEAKRKREAAKLTAIKRVFLDEASIPSTGNAVVDEAMVWQVTRHSGQIKAADKRLKRMADQARHQKYLRTGRT